MYFCLIITVSEVTRWQVCWFFHYGQVCYNCKTVECVSPITGRVTSLTSLYNLVVDQYSKVLPTYRLGKLSIIHCT